MSISALAKWEFRADATAGNANGGFFVTGASGVDYSQQTAAQYALTGVTSAGAGNVILSASAAADMVGNGIKVISGTNFTVGWFEITSVSLGVSITCSTNAAGASISSGVGATGVMNVGGAISFNTSGASGDDDVLEAASAGNTRYWRKAGGNFTVGEAISLSLSGTAAAPIMDIGYNTNRTVIPTGTDRPTIICAGTAVTWASFYVVSNFIFTTTNSAGITTGGSRFINCKVTNSTTSADSEGFTGSSSSEIENCEVISYRGNGIESSGGTMSTIKYSYFHDSNAGMSLASSPSYQVVGNIVESCVTAAIRLTATNIALCQFLQNTLFGSVNTTGIGFSFATGVTRPVLLNNIITGFVTGVNHADAAHYGQDNYNLYYNNDTDVTNWTKGGGDISTNPAFTNVGQVTGTAGAFTAGNDRLVDTSKNFSSLGVVALQDHIYIISGTGVTVGIYGITSITTTTNPNDTLILTPAPGTNTTTDKVYQITIGHNFLPTGTIIGFPGVVQGGLTTGYASIGAIQKNSGGGSSGTSTTFGG